MKKMKRILSLLVAVIMVLGLSVTTMAAEQDSIIGNDDDLGTITVNGITAEEGLEVKAYPIIKANYDGTNGNYTGLSVVYTDANPEISLETLDDGNVQITLAMLNAIIDKLDNSSESYDMIAGQVDQNGTVSYTANVPVGSYLVMIKNAETKIYSPVVVSVAYKVEENENALDEGTVTLIEDGNTWVKVSNIPTLDKSIVEDEKSVDGNTANIGEDVKYEIDVAPIPYYGGSNPTFNIVDTLSGLTYNEKDPVAVKVGDVTLTEGTDYTLTVENGVITIDFVVNGSYTLNGYQGEKMVITYGAIVNSNASLNNAANTNTAELNYTKDSKVTGQNGSTSDMTYTYTFDIDGTVDGSLTRGIITKLGEEVDSDGNKKPLAGAVFGIYTDLTCEISYTNSELVDGKVTSDSNGQLTITGLKAGTYYLKEISAPDGYSINTHVFTIVIVADLNETTGELKSWAISIDGNETAEFSVTNDGVETNKKENTTIQNTKLSSLPSTGGIGTTIFTVVGVILMVGAAGIFFISRKKRA